MNEKNKKIPENNKENKPSQFQINYILDILNNGRFSEAEFYLNQLCIRFPSHQFSWKTLGVLLCLTDQIERALGPLVKATNISVLDPEAYYNLGKALYDLGRLEKSESSYRIAIQIKPDYIEAIYNLGLTLNELGRAEESLKRFREAISIKQDFAEAYCALGTNLRDLGRLGDSEASLRTAIQIKPDYVDAQCNLGNTLYEFGRLEESEACYRAAIRFKPDYAKANCNVGGILRELGRLRESEASLLRAIRIKPDFVEALCNIGNTFHKLEMLEESAACYRKGLSVKPDLAEAYCNYGNILRDLGRLEESEGSFLRALRIKPDFVEALCNIGNTFHELGRLEESEASFREAIRIRPSLAEAHHGLLSLLSHLESVSASKYLEEAKIYGQLAVDRPTGAFFKWLVEPDPIKLRVGFVSGDLRSHPVGYFIEGLFKHLNYNRIELIAFSTSYSEDNLTARIKPYFNEWHTLAGDNDCNASKKIYGSRVNILIDLSGHTRNNRLGVFSYKPAPIQISWLGYWASTGVVEIDYLLGDPYVTPEAEDHLYTESVWRLPETRFCFTPPEKDICIEPSPYIRNGFITFGCFNNVAKLTDSVIALWSTVLLQAPSAKLFLKARQLSEPSVIKRIKSSFNEKGIYSDRLILEGPSSREEYLKGYNRIDIALDPFPFTGGTTTLEALWMGVPVISKRGNSLLSRQSEGILLNSGQVDWIAEGSEDYVAKAVHFANFAESLPEKSSIRSRVISSPMFDQQKFARHFEHSLWSIWCTRLQL